MQKKRWAIYIFVCFCELCKYIHEQLAQQQQTQKNQQNQQNQQQTTTNNNIPNDLFIIRFTVACLSANVRHITKRWYNF